VCLDLEESDFLTSLRTHHATEKDAAHYHSSNKSEIVLHVSIGGMNVNMSQSVTKSLGDKSTEF